jgi:HupE / UreJ protein
MKSTAHPRLHLHLHLHSCMYSCMHSYRQIHLRLRLRLAAPTLGALWAWLAKQASWAVLVRLLGFLALLQATPAWAHKSGDAYLTIETSAAPGPGTSGTGTGYRVHTEVALRDLDRELTLDANQDDALTWGEVRTRWVEIEALVRSGAALSAGGQPCQATLTSSPQLAERSDGAYAVLEHRWLCQGAGAAAGSGPSLRYTLFQRSDAGHRGLLQWAAEPAPRLLVPGEAPLVLQQAPSSFWSFVWEGIQHIAAGLDHILFLLTLVLVAVFTRQDKRWLPQATGRAAVVEALRIVTAFTVSHSITLGLAATGWLTPPSRLVESVIALSVLLAATDNVRQIFFMPRWALAGLFGWFHGFGFATPLQDLGLQGTELLMPLFAFNLGVELGQLAIVALVLPVAIAWRRSPRYQRAWMPGLSMAVAALAGVWLLERSLDVSVLGF